MLEFVAQGQWLALVPVPAVAEYLAVGSMIFASCRNSTDHRQCANKVHGRPHGVSEVAIVPAFCGFRGAYGFDLAPPKTWQTMARRLFQPEAIRSSSGLA